MQNLPTHRFKRKDGEDFTPEKIDELVKKDRRGYLLKVDVECPKEVHENHNELPFLVEKIKIGREKNYYQILEIKTDMWYKSRRWIKCYSMI